jgi:hypothetical protein
MISMTAGMKGVIISSSCWAQTGHNLDGDCSVVVCWKSGDGSESKRGIGLLCLHFLAFNSVDTSRVILGQRERYLPFYTESDINMLQY